MSLPRSEVFRILRTKGIGKVEVSFSGGNDEGGADEASFFDMEGAPIDLKLPEAYKGHSFDGQDENKWYVHDGYEPDNPDTGRRGKPKYREATDDERDLSILRASLETPIYERYHTFAGEFYVSGTLEWDVKGTRVVMDGNEEVKSYEPFNREV